ncbi:suppressor of G2 allele of SKP1 [Nematocida parisii]|uniref:SGS domain-containing protein n=1 Tax=Nematocida parisii (strain ERTm3) TaxID=935791 RepID=I3EIF4_NEMP3|nr:hypothetical protein NEQG_00820 [Nematocida parisii ERTm3]KAI5153406.1 suppressor of G2 allele of SKP1 [Nematocida parisii]
MIHEWYETREEAKIIIYPISEDVKTVVRTEEILSINMLSSTYTIRIIHEYTVEGYRRANDQLEITLKKPFSKKWTKLDSVPVMSFEKQKEIKTDKETLSNDPVMNMFMEVYANASDDIKREMNKSFYESSGTELRTHRKTDKDE